MAKIIYFAILLLYNMNKLRPACQSCWQKQLTPCGRDCRKGDLPQKHASDSMDSRTSGYFDSKQGIFTYLFNIQPSSNVFATVSKRCYKL